MTTYAAVTGRITIPGTDLAPGGRIRVTATPMSTDHVLSFTDRVTWGPRTVETDTAGNMPTGTAALRIPQDSTLGDVLFWKITAEAIDKKSGLRKWTVALAPITVDVTVQTLANPDVTVVTAELATTVGENAAAAAASEIAAAASEAAAEGWANAALSSAADAATDADAAAVSETNAAGSATTATTQAGIATTKAGEAAVSAAHADDMAGAAEAVAVSNDTIIAGRVNDPASATAVALSATYAPKVGGDYYFASFVTGAVDTTGATDYSTQLAAAHTAMQSFGGGRLHFPAGTLKFLPQCVIPNDGNATRPRQKPITWIGRGALIAGASDGSTPANGGTILDFRYAGRVDTATVTSGSATVADTSITAADLWTPVYGTGIPAGTFVGTVTPGVSFKLSSMNGTQTDALATANGTAVTIGKPKIDTRGLGVFSLEDLILTDNGTSSNPFLKTTNTAIITTPGRVAVLGNTSKGYGTCDQDAFILGGAVSPEGSGPDTAYQGYGTSIKGVFFGRIRRGVLVQTYGNAVVIKDNVFWANCGTNLVGGAAIEFAPVAPDYCVGASVKDNLIECVGYYYAVKADYTTNCNFDNQMIYDTGANYVSVYYFGAHADWNFVVDGYRTDLKPLVTEHASIAGKTTILTGHSSQTSYFPNPVKFTNATGVEVTKVLTVSGGAGGLVVQPAVATSDTATVIMAKRSAAEATNPGTTVFTVSQQGVVTVGGAQAGTINFIDAAGAAVGSFSAGGKNWAAAGSGGAMSVNTGSGGSYFTIRAFGLKLLDYLGTLTTTIKIGAGTPEGAFAAPVGSKWFRTDGGPGTTEYVKESGTGNSGWVATGGLSRALVAKTANFTATLAEQIIVTNGATVTITLPDPTTIPVGRMWTVKNINAAAATVVSAGTSKTLDGAASQSIAQWAKADYVSDGTQWLTV